jgi:hypothetical protein
MVAPSKAVLGGYALVVLGSALACGGISERTSDDDSSGAGSAGIRAATGGTLSSAAGGTTGGTRSSGSGGTSSGATGGTPSNGSGGTSSGTGAKGGSTSTGGTGGSLSGPGSGGGSVGGTAGAAAGAGGITIGGACPAFTPCGGDIVGRWQLRTICGATTSAGSTVPECSSEIQAQTTSGNTTYDFAADGTVTVSGALELDVALAVTDACSQASIGVDAATYCATVDGTASGSGGSSGMTSTGVVTNCTYTAPICHCQLIESVSTNAAGTYTVKGTQITVVTRQATTSDYCISGDTLLVSSATTSGGQEVATLVRD